MPKLSMTREKYSGLDGRTYVKFVEDNSQESMPFTIVASPTGVTFKGRMAVELATSSDFEAFAELVGRAAKDYTDLRKAVLSDLSRPS